MSHVSRPGEAPGSGLEPNPRLPRNLDHATEDLTEQDVLLFREMVSTNLTESQARAVAVPDQVFPRQREVLAIHWHPEWVPLDLVGQRLNAMFPGREQELVIPTQHNRIMAWGRYAGVEVDCYAAGFKRKVQLLLHFRADRVEGATTLKAMIQHTYKYRAGQLFEFVDSILSPKLADRLEAAAARTGANDEVVALTRFHTARLSRLIRQLETELPPDMIKNKLVSEYLAAQAPHYPEAMIRRALHLVQAVKEIVKQHFSLEYFYRATEVIEEARGLGGGVVIPHPEQFWPILLADYDVDGCEVWNPQSQEYTDFLIRALHRQNRSRGPNRRTMLVFMGDDTHMSVKIKARTVVDGAKTAREVGYQPAWDDPGVQKSLSLAGASRAQIIAAYKERLG